MRTTGAALTLGLALLLAGCGFHPLYAVPGGAHGSVHRSLGSIYVEPVPDRLGYELRNSMIDVIDGRAEEAGAAYRLQLTLAINSEAIGVQSQVVGTITQTAITRYNDTLTVNYELVDAKTGKAITSGTETGLSSYNVLSSPYATLAVQQDADKRAADDIADRIRIDLAVYFSQQPKR
ncbi:MAG: hypothetical protein KGI68_05005 [Alphaproteobacteria bacterium]|nr:hypothetical protein [Alphaproteobacteria bacterium]MDE1985495.1 hypothetical protein [Alphaproteobacteria bacterium]MDE2161588.1 hypothetical protein [Alphaproteobacteria bacterium]MDE2267177.1 hypothetical protein [Alphaproteobacteria bacterium]MDE2498825.1 hypothetical protein [Alphaproteobacteria bacterium]